MVTQFDDFAPLSMLFAILQRYFSHSLHSARVKAATETMRRRQGTSDEVRVGNKEPPVADEVSPAAAHHTRRLEPPSHEGTCIMGHALLGNDQISWRQPWIQGTGRSDTEKAVYAVAEYQCLRTCCGVHRPRKHLGEHCEARGALACVHEGVAEHVRFLSLECIK